MDVYNNENLNENTQSQNPNRYVSGVYKLLYRYILNLISNFYFNFQFSEDSKSVISDSHPQGHIQGGCQGGNCPPPLEKTIFTIFRMPLLIIIWIFGTFLAYRPYCPLVKKSCVRLWSPQPKL